MVIMILDGADLHGHHQYEEHDKVKVVVLSHTVSHPAVRFTIQRDTKLNSSNHFLRLLL